MDFNEVLGVRVMLLSCSVVSDSFAAPWTVAGQAPLSMDFPGKNTGVGCHFLFWGDPLNPAGEPEFPALQVDFLPLNHIPFTLRSSSQQVAKVLEFQLEH